MKLIVLSGEDSGFELPIEEGSNLIGRWDKTTGAYPEIDLEKYDPEAKVSRKHAVIARKGGEATIEDVGSLNGTFLNRTKRLEHGLRYPLNSGDEVMIGKTVLRFEA